MSANGAESEVLKPILLRSSTPAANEKVLKYLEGIQSASTQVDDDFVDQNAANAWGRTNTGAKSPVPIHSPTPKSRNTDSGHLEKLAESRVSYGDGRDDDEVASNVQDGQRSDLGSMHLHPVREPGPGDPPGPRYESFDSGPSFGNKGPLPGAETQIGNVGHGANHPPFSSWQPPWPTNAMQVPLSEGSVLSPGSPRLAGGQAWTASLASGAPNGPNGTNAAPVKSQSKQGSVVMSDVRNQKSRNGTGAQSPRSVASKVPTAKGADLDRAFSPVLSQKTSGTKYPPLPPSAFSGEWDNSPSVPKVHDYSPSKAHSVSPSDSLSNFHVKRSLPPKSPTPNKSPLRSSPSDVGENDRSQRNGGAARSQPPGSVMSGGLNSHQTRPFSPYRHAPTQEDLLHAALRGAASPHVTNERAPSVHSNKQAPHDADVTPTPSRPHTPQSPMSPAELNAEEQRMVAATLAKTPRTSFYAGSVLGSEIVNSHFHDMDLCVLLHEVEDPGVHDVVKKALRKAVRQRVKKLGMKYDNESIREYRKSYHDHDPKVHLQPDYNPQLPTHHEHDEPPEWAKELIVGMTRMNERLDGLGPKIDRLKPARRSYTGTDQYRQEYRPEDDDDEFGGRSPMTQTVNIHTQPTGTMAESMFQQPETEIIEDGDQEYEGNRAMPTDGETRTHGQMSDFLSGGRDDSPGQQFLEKELYKLRVKGGGSQSAVTHRTWEVARETEYDSSDDDEGRESGGSGMPEIPDTNVDGYTDRRANSPPLPPIPGDGEGGVVASPDSHLWPAGQYNSGEHIPVPWQRVHQRLLNWAIIWPNSELDNAVNSTTRGYQVDEVSLSIWSTQCYKRYVRAKMTDHPPGRVDRLFVPPNMADAINNAVFNGRHGDASGMLRDLWSPFGLEGMPRLLVVLAKHRSDDNHWVVHRFSLPDGSLTTYDSYPERTLPDGRPLGWWFAIRVAWPNAIYPSPDHLMQKMVRLHRPMQLGIDNSVAAAGIWRNVLMGSRAERSIDLERLRDLINTEVRNLRQRKQLGKLSIGSPRPTWEDLH